MRRSPRPMVCCQLGAWMIAGGEAGAWAEEGVVVSGVVLDASGRPLPWVSVGLYSKRGGGFALEPDCLTIADGRGRFALPPMPPGVYDVAPARDLQVIAGVTRPEQLPEGDRPRLEQGGNALIVRPLPATFVRSEVTLKAGAPAVEVTLRAVPPPTPTAGSSSSCPRSTCRTQPPGG